LCFCFRFVFCILVLCLALLILFVFVFDFIYLLCFGFVSEQNIFSSRFTQTAHRIIRKLTETSLSEDDAHEKEVIWVYFILGLFIHFCSKVLMLQLRENSKVSACGFFIVDRSLVTSFLATTFTYWVILIQFQTM